jgi:hypothetical protein
MGGRLATQASLSVGAAALLAAAVDAAPRSPQRGCADHWLVELDGESFANNGAGKTFTGAELAAFRAKLQAVLRSAVGQACREGKVRVASAAGIRKVFVLSASGATEPDVYAAGKSTLNLEWVFAEENLAVPSRAEIVDGLSCWTNPKGRYCGAEGD